MYGDYSRGHEPDRKRGKSYRRVLLQMGRPVLDSDVASSVDALLGEVRTATRGLGCAAASPDLGFLVTPGRLLAVFAEAAAGLEVTQGTPDAWLDYRYRYAGRYPALHVAGQGGAAGVQLPLLQPPDPAAGTDTVALWARVETATTIRVNGVAVNLTPNSPDEPQRVEFSIGGVGIDPLRVNVLSGAKVWLYLLEQSEVAGSEPAFWVAPGTYHVDGLIVDAHGGGVFPPVSFPDAAGFPWNGSPPGGAPLPGLLDESLSPGDLVVAYLEGWERHLTAVEDPGIADIALGPVDTCTRTELIGQVKVASMASPPATGVAAAARAAFEAVEVSGGEVTIDVPASTPTTDPCALPDLAGYTGADNRLYRVEVHEGGDLSEVSFKWSRDNGSELFATELKDGTLLFDPGTPLAAGDIVEVLNSVVDLGDDRLASVGPTGFEPAWRAVGELAQLAAVPVEASSDQVVFRLAELDDPTATVDLDERYKLPGAILKLRRWQGTVAPRPAGGGAPSTGPFNLEDGITAELSSTGSYRPGQYWQFEARVGGFNANGPWRPEPHGPERRFAPLALLEFQGAGDPLRLVAWLDERFSGPCDVDADGVSFAGGRVGSTSDTVQEALEELFERPVQGGTCTVTVHPSDDLEAAVASLPAEGGELCFVAGTYALKEPLVLDGRRRVVVHGAGPATVLQAGPNEAALVFEECTEVAVRALRVEGGTGAGAAAGHLNGAITFAGGTDLAVADCSVSCPDAPQTGKIARTQACVTARGGGEPLRIRLEGNRLDVGTMQTGVLLIDPAHAYVAGNRIQVSGARDLPAGRVVDQGIVVGGSAVGTVEILDNVVEQTIQGIHVAASGPGATREAVDAVLLSRNVVNARVPVGYRRDRHAVFVGNAQSIHVKDTIATLERVGAADHPTPVDAVRLYGAFGPFLAVRQTSTRGFTTGVHVIPVGTLPYQRMWLVSETMAAGAQLGADVPAGVEHERNYPGNRFVATLVLSPAVGAAVVNDVYTIRATALDVDGMPVAGVAVFFTVLGPANPRRAQAVVTNASGVAEFSYRGTATGGDIVSAFADSNGNGAPDSTEPPALAAVTFAPRGQGPQLVSVPGAIGLRQSEAAQTFAEAHLTGVFTFLPDQPAAGVLDIPMFLDGPFVVAQNPARGATAPELSQVACRLQRQWRPIKFVFENPEEPRG